MRESLAELFRELNEALPKCQDHASAMAYTAAIEPLRRVMSAASKLHTRLTILAELEEDAKFVAEVDRALSREAKSRVLPLPGDQPLPFPPSEGTASTPRRRGKGKGQG